MKPDQTPRPSEDRELGAIAQRRADQPTQRLGQVLDHRRHPHAQRRRRASALRRALASALACLTCALAVAACGEAQDVTTPAAAKTLKVMLDWFPNADHAALYTAIARGYFKLNGLNVEPVIPAESAEPLKQLAAGKVNIAISYEPQLLLAREAGLKVVSIAALVQRPLTSIIALPSSKVKSVADLAGKRVGTAGISYQAAELHTALRKAGVNPSSVTEVNVGFNLVQSMLSGKVAATLGGFWNYEAIQLRQMHKHPLVIPVNEAGVPTYDELILAVREHEARYDGEELRSFLQALSSGERAVQRNPQAAANLLVEANPDIERKLQLASIEATLPATIPTEKGKPYGWQSPSQWARFDEWMYSEGLLKRNPNKEGYPPFTNEFLPGQGI